MKLIDQKSRQCADVSPRMYSHTHLSSYRCSSVSLLCDLNLKMPKMSKSIAYSQISYLTIDELKK